MRQAAPSTQFSGDDLFDRYYTVKMLHLHSRSVDSLKRFGYRVSGVQEIDQFLDRQEIITEMNIDRMFEKYREGVTIRLLRYEDTAEIYKIIHSHLIAWSEYLSHGINTGNAPLKDLVELDVFAGVVYDKAKYVFSEEERNVALSTNFGNVQSLNFMNILKRSASSSIFGQKTSIPGVEVFDVNAEKEKEKAKYPERYSFKDVFATELARAEGWKGNSNG